MIFYLLLGALLLLAFDSPLGLLSDDSRARPSNQDLFIAVTVWCLALAIWPLMVPLMAICRTYCTVRDRMADRSGTGHRS